MIDRRNSRWSSLSAALLTVVPAAVLAALLVVFLGGCVSNQTHVRHADKAKAVNAKRVAVIYLTRGKVTYGNLVPQSDEPRDEPSRLWEIDQAVESAVRESLQSAGKQMTAFQIKAHEKYKPESQDFVTAIDAVLFIGENDIRMMNGEFYSGVGILTDQSRVFQTVITPFAMFAVAAKVQGVAEIAEAYNSKFVGGLGGSTAPLVEGVSYHDKLADFSPIERLRLKQALHARIRVVIRALFSDLGFAEPEK